MWRKLFGLWNAEQRRTYKELTNLNEAELNDIGLCRGDILNIVEGTYKK